MLTSNFGLIFLGWIGTLTAASSERDLKTTTSSLPFSSPVAHHLAGVCQHSPLCAFGSG